MNKDFWNEFKTGKLVVNCCGFVNEFVNKCQQNNIWTAKEYTNDYFRVETCGDNKLVCADGVYYKNNGYKIVNYEDIFKKEDCNMIYEKIKPKTLTAKDMYNSFPILTSNFDKIVKRFGFHTEIEWNSENEVFFFEVGLIQDLLKYNFIREIKNKIVYDESKVYCLNPGKRIYVLRKVNNFNYRWICVSSNFIYYSINEFDSPQSSINDATERNFNIEVFNNFQEAMNHYFPKVEKVETKLDKINKLYDLIKELNMSDIMVDCCHAIADANMCYLISCRDCPLSVR